MNRPLPRSAFGDGYAEGWQRIFGKRCSTCGGTGEVDHTAGGTGTGAAIGMGQCPDCDGPADEVESEDTTKEPSVSPAIICDLDGTLCNIDHRRHLVEGPGKKDWEAFFGGIAGDRLNHWCRDIILGLSNRSPHHQVIFVTGRAEQYRLATVDWLTRNGLHPYHFKLFMRADGDFRKDAEVKREIYHRDIKNFWDIRMVIDDRQQVVDMWRAEGLTCLQCDVGNF